MQLENVSSSIIVIEDGITIVLKLMHFSKAFFSIEVTDYWIEISSNDENWEKENLTFFNYCYRRRYNDLP